jgi:hypothetical protein
MRCAKSPCGRYWHCSLVVDRDSLGTTSGTRCRPALSSQHPRPGHSHRCPRTRSAWRSWGSMGAIIVEVNDDIVTLFTPSSQSSSRAMANFVQCDKMHFLEVAMGGCPVQIKILERFGSAVDYGEAKSWGERHGTPTSARPRGNNVSNVNYRKDGTAAKRGIYIYAPTTGNPDYSLVTFDNLQETRVYNCGKKEVEIKFAILQLEWYGEGYHYGGGGGGGGPEKLFLFTRA